MEDTSEQGPVHGPRLDGFGVVGFGAVDTFLADVNLPASKIGGCGFHGFGVYAVMVDESVGYMAVIDEQKVHLRTRCPSKDVRT